MIHPDLQVKYHSTHGALTESIHVFIRSGIEYFISQENVSEVTIFEMGFGTGLNALLAYRYCLKNDLTLHYTGIEKFLIDPLHLETLEIAESANATREEQCFFNELHQNLAFSSGGHSGRVIEGDFIDPVITDREFDIIFYDAFGPRSQPELWSEEIMKRAFDLMRSGGVMTTFCAQGQFRRNLKAAGFQVEKIAGPPGKRDMTRAIKP